MTEDCNYFIKKLAGEIRAFSGVSPAKTFLIRKFEKCNVFMG
ncbi:hypothetical protein DBT_0233 [Dissulfuribacter thermophilus]|uniref:Uncharacterized protein n=1 Tax=Dissulfuribacter thermophilus TaxID=1156395 RepID=A0A1B9F927_9BACT|nr:hypothetical protein DBT_0233 [Dissulfuribacter thermophilus]